MLKVESTQAVRSRRGVYCYFGKKMFSLIRDACWDPTSGTASEGGDKMRG